MFVSTSPNSNVFAPHFNPPMQYSFGSKSQQQLVPLFMQRDSIQPTYIESERISQPQANLQANYPPILIT